MKNNNDQLESLDYQSMLGHVDRSILLGFDYFHMGFFYENGLVVEKNLKKAKFCYLFGAKEKHDLDAKEAARVVQQKIDGEMPDIPFALNKPKLESKTRTNLFEFFSEKPAKVNEISDNLRERQEACFKGLLLKAGKNINDLDADLNASNINCSIM